MLEVMSTPEQSLALANAFASIYAHANRVSNFSTQTLQPYNICSAREIHTPVFFGVI